MADTAFQEQFRTETILAFESRKSQLRETCVKETMVNGNEATFLVAGSGSATTTTRGVDGNIPYQKSDLNQYKVTLKEEHYLERRTGFDVTSSQGDLRRIMQDTTAAVINRAIDKQILNELANATIDAGAAAPASLNLVIKAKTILGNNKVRTEDGKLFAAVTPAFMGYLQTIEGFASADYVDTKRLTSGEGGFSDGNKIIDWLGVKWMTHSELAGIGTSSATCFMYHQDSIGHGCHFEGMKVFAGYDEEQDYSFCRGSIASNAKILQNTGIVKILHNDSALSA